MTNLDSILKSRDITLPTKVCLVKVMFFPVVMYGCESWTVKKAERWRIDAFELCYWRRLLRIPWTSRRCNQSILKEISPGCSLEGLVLILKLQYLATHEKSWLIGKDPDSGRDCGQEEKWTTDNEILDGITDSMDMSLGELLELWWTGGPAMLGFMGSQRVRHDLVTELNWTDCKYLRTW